MRVKVDKPRGDPAVRRVHPVLRGALGNWLGRDARYPTILYPQMAERWRSTCPVEKQAAMYD